MAAQELNIRPIERWLDEGAPPAVAPNEVLLHLARRMVAAGIPLHRIAVFVRTLHPHVVGRGFIWTADNDAVEITTAEDGVQNSEQFLKSPVRVVFTQNVEVRRRLCDPASPVDFPILEDLLKEKATDFLALPIRFITGDVHVATFATRGAGGFSEAQVEALRKLMAPFSRIAEIYSLRRLSYNVVDAYLGQQTGKKVLAGKIRRGDGEDTRAVIWFCDLRDSTPLAESLGRHEFLALLNDYFECVLDPVQAAGGEILRFIGDAALAMFPVGDEPAAPACEKALAAAQEAVVRMHKLNAARVAAGKPALRFGIGLHLGRVLYGNIGTKSRIEFTVIGAAANEAARIEGLCKTLGVDLVLSERVAAHLSAPLKSLGKHTLRGVGEPVEIFTTGA